MKFLSICSGIEAASVAWEPLGWEAVGFSEIEPFPSAVLKHHYPDVPNYGDMTNFEEWPDMDIDLLCGGTPCQAFSVAGQRKGLSDDRGNLTLTFCGIADRYNPDWIMWENVPGVLSDKTGAFGCFLAELCGFDAPIEPNGGRWTGAGMVTGSKRTAAWRIIDAQYTRVDGFEYAVPQRRRRLFVVANPGTTGDPASVLFIPQSVQGDIEAGERQGKDSAGSAKQSAQSSCVAIQSNMIGRSLTAGCNGSGANDTGAGYTHDTVGVQAVAIERAGYTARRHAQYEEGVGTLKASGGDIGGGSETLVPEISNALCARDFKGARPEADQGAPLVTCFEPRSPDGYARTVEDANGEPIAPCLNTAQGGQRDPCVALDKKALEVRRLTPRECERLQGFPDDYTKIPWRGKDADQCPDGLRYKALGNSWAVNCARWIGRRIELIESMNNGK